MVSRYGLPFWFAIESILGVAVAAKDTTYLFFDARLYLEAARVWLAGGNPWEVQLAGNYFAAPPPTLLVFAPFTLLPAGLAVGIIALAVVGGAIATVRMLHLPWWWLLFPPLVQACLSANVQTLIVPLILIPGGALAIIIKIYAGLPLLILGRWRSLADRGRRHARDGAVPAVGHVPRGIRSHLATAGGPVEAHVADRAPRAPFASRRGRA